MATCTNLPRAKSSSSLWGLAVLAPVLAVGPAAAQTLSALTPPREPAPRSASPLALNLGGLPPSVLRQAFGVRAAAPAVRASRPARATAGAPGRGFPKLGGFGAQPTRGIQFGTLTFEDETHRYDANAYRRQGPVY